MTLRMPQYLNTSPRWDTGLSVLEAELQAERANALGKTGSELETALATLNRSTATGSERDLLVRAAARAAWSFFVQREACGLINHDQAIAHYSIPREVLARVGAG